MPTGGGLRGDKFPKLPRSLAIMSAISGDGVGYRHEGNLNRRTGGINTTVDRRTYDKYVGEPVMCVFSPRDGHSISVFGVSTRGRRKGGTIRRLRFPFLS